MPGILDLVDAVNILSRIEAVVGALLYNTRRSPRVHGVAALPSAHEIRVSRYSEWSGTEVVRFLTHYGVDVWGGRTTSDHFIMYVKDRQAKWAEYLLLRRGIPVDSVPCDSRNLTYAAAFAPGSSPPAWNGATPLGVAAPPVETTHPLKIDNRWE
jgi:hypothetical protein